MFEGDSADTFGGKFLLMLMGGGRAEGLACADPEARTPIGASGIFLFCLTLVITTKRMKPIDYKHSFLYYLADMRKGGPNFC